MKRQPAADTPILSFESATALRRWLEQNHTTSEGIWIRIYKVSAHQPGVTFPEVLDAGLCFGWSESLRRRGDEMSYLQRFSPRRRTGTTSSRNRERVRQLVRDGKMTPAGLAALAMDATSSAVPER